MSQSPPANLNPGTFPPSVLPNFIPPSVEPMGSRPAAPATLQPTIPGKPNPPPRRSRVSAQDLLQLTTQLAIMTRAGVDLAGAIESLALKCKSPYMRYVLECVHADLSGGKSLSDSLRKHGRVFNDTYIASVAAGESSGNLPEILNQLTQLLRSDLRIRSSIRSLISYPLVLLGVSTTMIFSLMCFVLPEFASVFAEADVPLPALTQIIVDFSSLLRGYFWLWLSLLILGVTGMVLYRRSPAGRRRWDRLLLSVYPFRMVTQSLAMGRIFRLLGTTITSGVPVLEGIRLTHRSTKNSVYRDLFARLEEEILNGRNMAPVLAEADLIPPGAAEMLSTAEKTGTLGMVTQMLGEHFEEDGQARLRDLVGILEPMMIVVMGLLVGLIVVAVMLPMFDMATLAGAN